MSLADFTDRARKIVALAYQEAERLGCEQVDAAHLFLGLLDEGSGVAAHALKNLDVDFSIARRDAENILFAAGSGAPDVAEPSRAQGLKEILQLSLNEARGLNHNFVGSEHILLGLLRDRKGVASQVLRKLRLEYHTVRAEILRVLGPPINREQRSRPLPPHISVGPVGRAVLGLCAFLTSLFWGGIAAGLAVFLIKGPRPAALWKPLAAHLVLDACAVTSIFMLLLAISFWAGGSRRTDPLLHKIARHGVLAVVALLAMILVAASIVLVPIAIAVPMVPILSVGCVVIVLSIPYVIVIVRHKKSHNQPKESQWRA